MKTEQHIAALTNSSFLNEAFPFHFIMNENMRVLSLGRSQKKVGVLNEGDLLFDQFSVERPLNVLNYEDFKKHKKSLFILKSKNSPEIKFRGQMYHEKGSELICFLGSPLIHSFDDLNNQNLALTDFAISDSLSQFLFTLQMQLSALDDSKKVSDKLRTYKQELEKALQDAKETKQKQQSFFAKMSHELRTPLNAIIGMSHLLEDTILTEQQKKYISAVSFSSTALLKIINDILDFSKLKRDQFTLEEVTFSLKHLLEEIHQCFKFECQEKDIELSYFIDHEITLITGDPLRISQVLKNLVQNSIKFTSSGSIQICAELKSENKSHQSIQFSVSDTGKGIKKENLLAIFDDYVQEDRETEKKYGGTGLGLSIVKDIISKYNAEIHAESEFGKGSKFYFTLKLKKDKKEEEKESKNSSTSDFNGLKMLIVEDNEINCYYAKTILNNMGVQTSVAINGIQALEKVQNESFDVILMDVQMPEMDGLMATEHIRKELINNTKIIGLSANTIHEEVMKCHKVGMNGFVSKPFRPDTLFKKIQEVLNLPD